MESSLLQQIQKGKVLKKAVTRDCSQPLGDGSRARGDVSLAASTAASLTRDMGTHGQLGIRAEELTQLQKAGKDADPAPSLSWNSMRVGREQRATPQAMLSPTQDVAPAESSSAPCARPPHVATSQISMTPSEHFHRTAHAVPRADIFNFPPVTQLPPPPERVAAAAHKQHEGRMPLKSDSQIALQTRAFCSSITRATRARATRARATTDPFPSVWASCSSSSSSPMLPLSWQSSAVRTRTSMLDAVPAGKDAPAHHAAKPAGAMDRNLYSALL
jgi:hypothetical protein